MTKEQQKPEWRPVVESDGERLELKINEAWDGVFLGTKVIPRTNPETGETEDAILVLLADAEDRRYNIWAGFTLRKAIEHLEPGSPIRLVDHGLLSLNAGRRMRQIDVYTA
jgi:hypothetical protein